MFTNVLVNRLLPDRLPESPSPFVIYKEIDSLAWVLYIDTVQHNARGECPESGWSTVRHGGNTAHISSVFPVIQFDPD